jgi:hypothetical protein
MTGYVDDLQDGAEVVRFGDTFSGKLNFTAETSVATGVINLKPAPGPVYYDEEAPVYVDEAYVRAYFGIFDIEGGLRRLAWGKAGSDITSTQITAALSKKFLRDEMELKAAVIWEAESGACLVMPALVWTKNGAGKAAAAPRIWWRKYSRHPIPPSKWNGSSICTGRPGYGNTGW